MELFSIFIENINKIKDKIFNDKKLKNYQKAKLLKFYAVGLEKNYASMEKYLETIFGYYFFEEFNPNSVLNKSLELIKYIVDNLTEKSELFFPLLLINSGIGFIEKNETYCFSMLSPKMIRNHLKELIPEFIVLYYDSKDPVFGETEKSHGILTINTFYTFPNLREDNLEMLYLSMEITENFISIKDLANTVIFLIYEICSHNKFINRKRNVLNSPKKFFNKKNQIIEMVHYQSESQDEKYYKCLSELDIQHNKGDSGQLIEYFFGFCKFGKILEILPSCKKIEGLFEKNNFRYWIDDLHFFRKYIEIKFIGTLIENNFNHQMKVNVKDLNSEINDIQEYIKKERLNVDNLIKKNFETFEFPQKRKKINDNEYESLLNFLSGDSEKGKFQNFIFYLKQNMKIKRK